MGMQEFIAKIAKGPKASKDLTWDEAKRAMQALIEGDATAVQVGAFLVAMRLKMESVTELASFTAAARSYVAPLPIPQDVGVVDLPSYAGKQDTFHALAGAAILAAAAGGTILMHGYDGIPGRAGNAGVLKALGIPIDLGGKTVANMVTKHGFGYLDIALYHPPLYRFLELRQELGVRSVFHPIARLLNPARASSQVVGLTHPPHNQVGGGQRDWVLLNAGLLLYAGGKGASLADSTCLARRALEDGSGARKLEVLTQMPVAIA
jgi:anthranilate phosphoribosyltransferase